MDGKDPEAFEIVEKDFSMLFILSLWVVLFVFVGLMKARFLEAGFEEDQGDQTHVGEEAVRISFQMEDGGPVVDFEGTRYPVGKLDRPTLEALSRQVEGKRVEVRLDREVAAGDWFEATFVLTRHAKTVEFTTR